MSNLYNFRGKVALVTGSSSGIGASTAIHFAKFGGQVVITGRNQQRLQKVFDDCKKGAIEGSFKTSNPVIQLIGDVSDMEFCKKLIKTTIDSFSKFDILVNNAAFGASSSIYDAKLLEIYDKMMQTNLKSVIALTQLAVPYLEKTKGVIINVSSVGSMKPSQVIISLFFKCILNTF